MIRGYMLRHTWNSLGGRVFYRFDPDDKNPASTVEKITRIPGIQLLVERFIKVSDYGITEELRDERRPKTENQNLKTLTRDRKIREILKSNPSARAGAVARELIDSGIDPAYKNDKNNKKLIERIDLLRMRYYGDPFQSQMSLTRDKEELERLEQLRREDLGSRR